MDMYTKATLTVIAVALAVIAFKLPMTGTAHALGDACGSSATKPCYTEAANTTDGMRVYVTNLQ